jgi:hypothetical protein
LSFNVPQTKTWKCVPVPIRG